MNECLLPSICVTCGNLSFDGTPHTCAEETPLRLMGEDDALLANILGTKLPIALAARNLRDVVRSEGVGEIRKQMGELADALADDLYGFCLTSLTHRHVDRDYVMRAVRAHLTKIAAYSGGAEA